MAYKRTALGWAAAVAAGQTTLGLADWMVGGSVIDWSSHDDARAALSAGKLPDGFSINEAGALVIPDKVATGGPFGFLVVIANFDYVVTDTGRIVKDRDGVLKAARAV